MSCATRVPTPPPQKKSSRAHLPQAHVSLHLVQVRSRQLIPPLKGLLYTLYMILACRESKSPRGIVARCARRACLLPTVVDGPHIAKMTTLPSCQEVTVRPWSPTLVTSCGLLLLETDFCGREKAWKALHPLAYGD